VFVCFDDEAQQYWLGFMERRAPDNSGGGSHGAIEISTVAWRQRDISHSRDLMPVLRFRFSLARRID
jgi:hypothetical protein